MAVSALKPASPEWREKFSKCGVDDLKSLLNTELSTRTYLDGHSLGEADIMAVKALSGCTIAPEDFPHVFRFVNQVYSLAKQLPGDSQLDRTPTEAPPVVFPAHTYFGGKPVSSSMILPHMKAAHEALAGAQKEPEAESGAKKSGKEAGDSVGELKDALPAVRKTGPAYTPKSGELEHGTWLSYALL